MNCPPSGRHQVPPSEGAGSVKKTTLNRWQKTFTMKKVQYQGLSNQQAVSLWLATHTSIDRYTHTLTHTLAHILTRGINKKFALFALHARRQRCVYVTKKEKPSRYIRDSIAYISYETVCVCATSQMCVCECVCLHS